MNLTAPASATVPCPVPTQTPVVHVCAHCHQPGTTVCGALWRVSPATSHTACTDLYYLHSRCLAPYKAVSGLRSVEGRLPVGTTHARPRLARRSPPATPVTLLAHRSAAS